MTPNAPANSRSLPPLLTPPAARALRRTLPSPTTTAARPAARWTQNALQMPTTPTASRAGEERLQKLGTPMGRAQIATHCWAFTTFTAIQIPVRRPAKIATTSSDPSTAAAQLTGWI